MPVIGQLQSRAEGKRVDAVAVAVTVGDTAVTAHQPDINGVPTADIQFDGQIAPGLIRRRVQELAGKFVVGVVDQ